MMKKWIAILTTIIFLTSCQAPNQRSLTGNAVDTASLIPESLVSHDLAPTESPAVPAHVDSINKSGSILLSCSYYQLIQSDMEFCDEVAVAFDGQVLTLPICLKDRDVDLNMPYLQIEEDSGKVSLTMYKADFSEKYGVDMNTQFALSLAVKGGYQSSYYAHQLHRSENRSDYRSDAEFANYRMVATSGVGKNRLYRSSNPLGHKIYTARPPYADQLLRKSGIHTVVNLANDAQQIRDLLNSPAFDSPGYQSLLEQEKVFYCHASTDLTSPEFTDSLIQALKYIAKREGPYLIHCNEGKDRTGILCALLECLCGSSLTEVTNDYMQSFENYYGIERESEYWQILAEGNILTSLSRLFIDENEPAAHTKELETLDLSDAASSYLQKNGLTRREIDKIKKNLS